MNRRQALKQAADNLARHNIDEAPLESAILLRYVLQLNRTDFFREPSSELTPAQEQVFFSLVERRMNGEPSAYITGHKEFFGLDLYIDNRVLIPRPETEMLVEKAIEIAGKRPATIADIGTGSGAIAVSLAVNLPEAKIYATDISESALEVASINCRKFSVTEKVRLLQGNLLEPLPGPVDIVVTNLPYVKENELAGLAAEPEVALRAGPQGLDLIRLFIRTLPAYLKPGGSVLLEIGRGQAEEVVMMLRLGYSESLIEVKPDLAGIKRMVVLTISPPRG